MHFIDTQAFQTKGDAYPYLWSLQLITCGSNEMISLTSDCGAPTEVTGNLSVLNTTR